MTEDDAAFDSLKTSQQPVKIAVERNGFRILFEGTIASVNEELDTIALFIDRVADKIGSIQESPEEAGEPVQTMKEDVDKEIQNLSAVDVPSIKSSSKTIENLMALFNTPWGKTPRTLAEIMKALEVNAIPDRVESVNVYLRRLVQRGYLRRIEKEKKYRYFKLPE